MTLRFIAVRAPGPGAPDAAGRPTACPTPAGPRPTPSCCRSCRLSFHGQGALLARTLEPHDPHLQRLEPDVQPGETHQHRREAQADPRIHLDLAAGADHRI